MGEDPRYTVAPAAADHVHESSDVAIRPLAIFLAFLVLSLLLVAVFIGWLFSWFLAHTNTAAVSRPPVAEAQIQDPRLQVSPRRELEMFREREDRQLAATEWIDRKQGVVRIPIERALELVAERGFPNWPKADVNPPLPAGEQPTATPPLDQSGGRP